MSFAGHVLSMISSLKNNARRRKSIFDKERISVKTSEKWKVLLDQKASPKYLEELRKRIQFENKKIYKRKIVLLIFILLFVFFAAIYFLN